MTAKQGAAAAALAAAMAVLATFWPEAVSVIEQAADAVADAARDADN